MTTDETIKYEVLCFKKSVQKVSHLDCSVDNNYHNMIALPLSEYIAVPRNSDEVGKVLEYSNYRDADVN
jgi:hypothetical protein